MSWLYRAAGVEIHAQPSVAVEQALVETAFAWQRSGVRPTIAETLMLSEIELRAWLKAGELREAADRDDPTPTEMAREMLDAWRRGDL